MSHPDPLYDSDNSYDDHDDFCEEHCDPFFEDFYEDNHSYDDENSGEVDWDYNDNMDGDHDSAMNSIGWDVDEGYGHYGEDY